MQEQASKVAQGALKKFLRNEGRVLIPLIAVAGFRDPERLTAWLVENGSIWLITFARVSLPRPQRWNELDDSAWKKFRKYVRNVFICLSSNLIAEQGGLFLLHLISTRLFTHIGFFREQIRSAHPFSISAFKDWCKGSINLHLFAGGLALALIESLKPRWAEIELETTPFDIRRFLSNLAIVRVALDMTFYALHRGMHENAVLYNSIHRFHHTDFQTNLRTNLKFTAIDLFLESAAPFFVGLSTVRVLFGRKMSRFEILSIMSHTAFHELSTHLGKPLQVTSIFPPLSLFYNSIVDVDKKAVEFHESHHNYRRANFGITPWLDHLLGTARYHPPERMKGEYF